MELLACFTHFVVVRTCPEWKAEQGECPAQHGIPMVKLLSVVT